MASISGGEKLEAYLRETSAKVSKPGTLRVGFLEGATYPDGTPVATVAAIQNFGAPAMGIPPRPFFTDMIDKKASSWPAAIGGLLKDNDMDATKALVQTGQAISGQLRQSIVDTNSPPLSPKTIARKGFEKPLVDTGHMLNSIDSEVS